MRIPRTYALLAVLALLASGCASMMHDLQPHRLRRLNRHAAPSMDPEFSAIEPQLPHADGGVRAEPLIARAQQ